MFKNMIVYRIAESWQGDLQQLEEALGKSPFAECGATQERSAGWVPPRGEPHGPLAESVANQWVMRFMTEAKMLPASVLNRRVNEKAAHIEATEGRKPGKKEKKELKDEAKLDLLPMAFTKQGAMWVWLDPQARTLVLDTGRRFSAQLRPTPVSANQGDCPLLGRQRTVGFTPMTQVPRSRPSSGADQRAPQTSQ